MGDPRRIRPDEVEIVVARELRKAGLALSIVRVLSRRALAPDDETAYAMELAGLTPTSASDAARRDVRDVLIEFRNEASVTGADALRALAARVAPAAPTAMADGPKRLQPPAQPLERPADVVPSGLPLRVMVSTAGFDAVAALEAQTLGMILLRLADGAAAFRRSQWAMGDQPPAWVPEYMGELVDLGPDGHVRYQLITGATPRLSGLSG